MTQSFIRFHRAIALLMLVGGSIARIFAGEESSPAEVNPQKEETRAFAAAIQPFLVAQQKNDSLQPTDLPRLRQNMELFWSAFPDSQRSATLLSSYMGLFEKVHAGPVATEWSSFANCKSPVAADLARGKIRFFELAKEPFTLRFTSIDGREIDLASLRGKVVLIDF